MSKIIQEYKEQIKYFLNNKKYMITVLLVAILSYGFAITHYSIGVDDLCFDRYINGTYILSAKRWGTWALYNIFRITEFSPFWLDLIVTIFMVVIAIIMSAFIRKQLGDKFKIGVYTIFACLFISNPLSNHFYIYQSTNFAIVISNLIMILCGIVAFENYFGDKKKILYLICGVILTIPISMYESCAQTYLVFMFIAILIKLKTSKVEKKEIIKYFALNIGVLVIGIALYYILGAILIKILKCLNKLEVNFAFMNVVWTNEIFKQQDFIGKMKILNSGLLQLFIKDYFNYLPITIFGIASFIAIIIELVKLIKSNKVLSCLSVLGIILSNFIIMFIQGKILYRIEFSIILSTAFLCTYIYMELSNKNWKKYVLTTFLVWLIIIQTRTLNQYFYNDYKRYEKEKIVANDIALNIIKNCDYKDKALIFVTTKENKENRYRINHDNGELVFEWGIEAFREYETEATKFINEQGYDFLSTSEENVKKAVEEYNQLTKEQKNQVIVELSESIIIKLDYYNLF